MQTDPLRLGFTVLGVGYSDRHFKTKAKDKATNELSQVSMTILYCVSKGSLIVLNRIEI